MKQKPPPDAQPVKVPRVPRELRGIPLNAATMEGSVDAFLLLLAEVALEQVSRPNVIQSDFQPQSLKKAA